MYLNRGVFDGAKRRRTHDGADNAAAATEDGALPDHIRLAEVELCTMIDVLDSIRGLTVKTLSNDNWRTLRNLACNAVSLMKNQAPPPRAAADLGSIGRPVEVPWEALHSVSYLAKGQFGAVFKATAYGAPCAFKILYRPMARETLAALVDDLMNEHRLLMQAAHPCVLRVYGVTRIPKNAYGILPADVREPIMIEDVENLPALVMDLMDGNLCDYLKDGNQSGDRPPALLLRIALDIAGGIQVLHHHGILHRDIKPTNIMYKYRGDRVEVFVADFGLSRHQAHLPNGIAGSPYYMAPELFHEAPVWSDRVDVYSFAITMAEIVSAKSWKPALNLQKDATTQQAFRSFVKQLLEDTDASVFRPGFTNEALEVHGPLVAILKKCWVFERSHRPTMSEVWEMLRDSLSIAMLDHASVRDFWGDILAPKSAEDFCDSVFDRMSAPRAEEVTRVLFRQTISKLICDRNFVNVTRFKMLADIFGLQHFCNHKEMWDLFVPDVVRLVDELNLDLGRTKTDAWSILRGLPAGLSYFTLRYSLDKKCLVVDVKTPDCEYSIPFYVHLIPASVCGGPVHWPKFPAPQSQFVFSLADAVLSELRSRQLEISNLAKNPPSAQLPTLYIPNRGVH